MAKKKLEQPRYILKGFYCQKCGSWHYENEKKFYVCINLFGTYYSFKVDKEVSNG